MSTVQTEHHHAARETLSHNGHNVILCETCHFWHVDPIPSRSALEKYYQDIYFQNPTEHGDMKDKNTDPDGYYRLKYADKLANFEKLLKPGMPKSILDIGAGFGEWLEFMQQNGWDVHGVEPAKHCLEKGRGEKCGIIQGELEDLRNVSLPSVSVITLNTVLEHVPYPENLLIDIRDHLMDSETILHIEIPNDFSLLQSCVNALCNPRKYWLSPIGHLNYWSYDTFKPLVQRLGFKVEFVESTFPLELLALLGDDYISDPSIGRQMHLKRVNLEKRFAAANAAPLKQELFKQFARAGMGREILAYLRKTG